MQVVVSGRACTNCARVKCKCIYRADVAGCERCHRLGKDCTSTRPAPRRPPRRQTQQDVSWRAARLEEKLDDLVSFLRTQRDSVPKDSRELDNHDGTDEESNSNSGEDDDELELDTPNTSAPSSSAPATAAYTPEKDKGGPSPAPAAGQVDQEWSFPNEPPPAEAKECLKQFRADTIPFFPYLDLPPYVTAQQMRIYYPFLWLNIMATASVSPRRRFALAEQAKNIIIQKVVVERQKSVDLLLGLITFLSWSYLYPGAKPYTALFSQLAVTLVCDLELHRPSRPQHACNTAKEDVDGGNSFLLPEHSSTRPTLLERRAVLGAYVLTSTISNIFKRADGLRWSPWLDECLNHLAERGSGTVDQDEILIAQVRVQLVIDQLYSAPMPMMSAGLPPTQYVSCLQARLREITARQAANAATANNPMMLMLVSFAELLIYEPLLSKAPGSTTNAASWNDPSMSRFEVYHGALVAIKGWLDTFMSTPVVLFRSMTLSSYHQLVSVLACLFKLYTLQDAAWDKGFARKTVDLLATCDAVIGVFSRLKAAPAIISREFGEDDAFSWGLTVLQRMKDRWQVQLAEGGGGGSNGLGSGVAAQDPVMMDYAAVTAAQSQGVMASMGYMGNIYDGTALFADAFTTSWE